METKNVLGNTLTFTTPSGFEVTIREQNGGDDEVISKMANTTDGSAVNKFASNIILRTSLKDQQKVSPDQVRKWKNKDKYYTIFKSRIFSLGDLMLYKHTCSNKECGKENTFEETLTQYDVDFSKPNSEDQNDFKYRVTKYPMGEALTREIELSSKKKLRYEYFNGEGEKKLLEYNKDNISKNTEFIVRNLEWFNEGKWQKVTDFKMFSSREMTEIRSDIKKNDEPFDAITEATCPFCKKMDKISLMAQADFFFPGETL